MRALHAVAITVGLLTIGAASASLAAAPKPASSIAVTAPGLGCSTPAGATASRPVAGRGAPRTRWSSPAAAAVPARP